MAKRVKCATHGDAPAAYVCTHLAADAVGLGFNRGDPTPENPFPDAWCDDCESIRAAHDGWNRKSEALTKIVLLCSGCYKQACIRNTRTAVRLEDLADLRWKCADCEEWHTGACLDYAYDRPTYWDQASEEKSRRESASAKQGNSHPDTFLDQNYCAVDGEDFFVRGIIYVPILGSAETLRWGVWGSLSRQNFERVLKHHREKSAAELPPMFSWLGNRIAEYPDTLNLKMKIHILAHGQPPRFELESSDHPLSQEFHHGISPQRVKEITLSRAR